MRKPTDTEISLINFLIKQSNIELKVEYLSDLLVADMDDGEMGSLFLYPDGILVPNRKLGKQVAEYHFKDMDDMDVIVSLNIDSNGLLFELDIWKANFDKLIKLPVISE